MTARLARIARLYELQLEEARVQHAAAESELERRREAATRTRRCIEDSQAFAQRLVLAGAPAAMLLQVRGYEDWQARNLEAQQKSVREAAALAQEAHGVVLQRFRRLSTIERLQERREREATVEHLRREQKTLDEHALVRAASLA
jgi:flagellar export protein FliJ